MTVPTNTNNTTVTSTANNTNKPANTADLALTMGDTLDESAVIGMTASISSYSKTVLKEELKELVTAHGRMLFRTVGQYFLIAHVASQTGSALVSALMQDIISMCQFLYGQPDTWDTENLDVRGAQDLIHGYILKTAESPDILLGGLKQSFVDPEVGERLNGLLTYMESCEGIYGNSSLLFLGESVLYSRFDQSETRMIQHYYWLRPLENEGSRYIPVYVSGSWKHLCLTRINSYVLAMLCFLDRPLTQFQERLDEFKMSVSYSRIELPTEEPPVALRLFAKRETLCLVYHNIKTGVTIAPELRPGPEIQQRKIQSNFWWLFCQACYAMNMPGVTEFLAVKDGFRFYARMEGVHRLYMLTASSTTLESLDGMFTDILKNVIQRTETTLL